MSIHASFLSGLVKPAQDCQSKYDLFASVTLAQAALESGWGGTQLSQEAHNLFGIKGEGPAGYLEQPTWEFVNGKRVEARARFRRYHNVEECLEDRARILTHYNRYVKVLLAGTPDAQARALSECGWATDPRYSEKLISILDSYALREYDLGGGFVHASPGLGAGNKLLSARNIPNCFADQDDSHRDI